MANHKFTVSESYLRTHRMSIPADAYQSLGFTNDDLPVVIDARVGHAGSIRSVRLTKNGVLTSVSKVYRDLGAEEGDVLEIEIIDYGTGKILQFNPSGVSKEDPDAEETVLTVNQLKELCKCNGLQVSGKKSDIVARLVKEGIPLETPLQGVDCVWMRQGLRPIDFEQFKITNMDWEPATEPDVYLAFKALEEHTGYVYCSGYSKELGRRLRYTYTGKSKPDAILIHDQSREYRMCEFKIYSSEFTTNHDKDDVDVLICWFDDETDRGELPDDVVDLRKIAQSTASIEFRDSDID